MNLQKIGIALLALLLAAIAIVPLVSAAELNINSVAQSEIDAVSVDVTAVRLPTLQSEKNAVMIDIPDEFVIDENIQNNQISENLKSSKKLTSAKIPFGVIVRHAKNGITTVYDSTGKVLFSTDDTKAPKIDTPNGLMPVTNVFEVPDKSVIDNENEIVHVFYQKQRILTVIDEHKKSEVKSTTAVLATNYPAPWIEGAKTSVLANVGHFLVRWNVPARPLDYHPYPPSGDVTQGSKITIWNGLQKSDGTKLLQPVLEWYVKDKSSDPNPSSPAWSMATWWAVAGSPGIHSTRRYIPTTGDQMQGNMYYSGGYWMGAISDMTQGGSSTLFLTSSQSSALSYQNLQPFIVLEGWNPQSLPGLNSRYLCGDITFNGFIIENTNGASVLPASVTGFINNQFWSPFTYGLSVNTASWPASVTLNTEN